MKARLCIGILPLMIGGHLYAEQKVALTGRCPAKTVSANAIRVLEDALRGESLPSRWVDSPQKQEKDETLISFNLGSGGAAESFSILKSADTGKQAVSIIAADETGLAYGVFELLGMIQAAGHPVDVYKAATKTTRAPQVRVRSLAMMLHNRELEQEWFFSMEFWNSYFELLSRSRYNQFTLIYGQQSPYFGQ